MPASTVDYVTFLEEVQPRLLNGTVWIFTAIAGLILWYRLPVAPLHKSILLGYVPYLLYDAVFLKALLQASWQRDLIGYVNQSISPPAGVPLGLGGLANSTLKRPPRAAARRLRHSNRARSPPRASIAESHMWWMVGLSALSGPDRPFPLRPPQRAGGPARLGAPDHPRGERVFKSIEGRVQTQIDLAEITYDEALRGARAGLAGRGQAPAGRRLPA